MALKESAAPLTTRRPHHEAGQVNTWRAPWLPHPHICSLFFPLTWTASLRCVFSNTHLNEWGQCLGKLAPNEKRIMAAFDFTQTKYNIKGKKKKKGKFTFDWPLNLLLRREVFTSFELNLIVFVLLMCLFPIVAFVCRVPRPEPTPYLPQLSWRRLCSFHTSRRRSGTPMLRPRRPDTPWPWRSAVSAASWKETQTAKSWNGGTGSVSFPTRVHIVKHSWLLRGTKTAAAARGHS